MSEVRYSVNGKYFKDFGTYISSSEGLFDALKRKKINSYDWAEYHGSAPDLSNPKFEDREITLVGFVVGENWEVMKSNFDAIISEFQKAGTQRLLIEPFGLKALPYEVYMDDSISLKKTFKNGKMVGTFTLKMIEPNPIKKVLYFTGDTLNLSYNSPNETEIFYGNGLKETAKGNVSLSNKTLANRVVSGYAFEGRNLIEQSDFAIYGIGEWAINGGIITTSTNGLQFYTSEYGHGIYGGISGLQIGKEYVLSIWTKATYQENTLVQIGFFNGTSKFIEIPTSGSEYIKTSVILTAGSETDNIIFYNGQSGDNAFLLKYIKLELGNKATDWTPAPEDEKHIIIAGNVEEITDLTTNADVLWEKL